MDKVKPVNKVESKGKQAESSAFSPVSSPETSVSISEQKPEEKLAELFGASKVDWSSVLSTVQSSPEAVNVLVGNSSYMEKMIKGHKKSKETVNGIFDIIYESVSDDNQLHRIIEARFDFKVGTGGINPVDFVCGKLLLDNKEQKFGINGLKRMYGVMLKLPSDHVKRLVSLTTDNLNDNCPSGVTQSSKYINIAYNENNTTRTESGSYADNGDAMYGMTIFDTTLAHEMGHVGDKGDRYSRDSEFLNISEWKEYKSAENVVDAMMGYVKDPLPSELDSSDVTAAKNAAKKIVKKENTDSDKYGKIIKNEYKENLIQKVVSIFKKGDESKADKENRINKKVNLIKGSNLLMHIQRAFAKNSPWMDECFLELPKYQIHQGYSGRSWWSYKNTAREGVTKNSRYQWRDPGEDFAELYATYFMGDDKKKQEIESQRKEWFERVVVNGGNKKSN